MAWNDLSIAQKSQMMNFFRQRGVNSLSEMKQLYDSAYPSSGQSDWGGNVPPVFADGGPVSLVKRLFAKNYKNDSFGEAFRQARIDGKDFFKWNENTYSTDMKPTILKRDKTLNIPGITKKQMNTMQEVWNHLRSNNTSARNTAAIMGNIMKESSFNPDAVQAGGDKAVGLFQFHGDRLKDYYSYLEEIGGQDSQENQLNYILSVSRGERPDFYMNGYNNLKSSIDSLENIAGRKSWEEKELQEKKDYFNKVYKKREQENRLFPIEDFSRAFEDENLTLDYITDLFTDTIERAGKPEYEKRRSYAKNIYNYFYGVPTIAENENVSFAQGGKIHIKKSKRGTFTAAAKKHGMSVQAFARKVLANPDEYSPAMRKKANFARNASKWKAEGGELGLLPILENALDNI